MSYSVAVIIPTLNEEKFIAQCLDCVIDQTYPFKELDLMVIDGGSTDGTENIVRAYSQHYPNIRFLRNPGKIQSIAFNIGYEHSDAPYIVRMDAHALYNNDYIEKCIQGLKDDETRGNVGGRCKILPYNDSIWANTNAILNYSRFGIGGSAFRVSSKPHNVDSVPFGTFPRKVIEKVGGMREDLKRGEDNEINSRIRKAGYIVFFDPEIVSSYYARPTFKSSCQQMFANGESIGHLFYIDKSSVRLRHLMPLLFVLGIFLGIVGSLFSKIFLFSLSLMFGIYLLCNLFASIFVGCTNKWKYVPTIFLLFFSVHLSYGVGTIVGFFTGVKLLKR